MYMHIFISKQYMNINRWEDLVGEIKILHLCGMLLNFQTIVAFDHIFCPSLMILQVHRLQLAKGGICA